MNWEFYESPIGILCISANDHFLIGIRKVLKTGKEAPNEWTRKAVLELKEYFQLKRTSFDLPLFLEGTDFQKQVWLAIKDIPYGSFLSYQDVARKINRPKSSQAVGQALSKNPFLIVIPCHRVIGKNGMLTGFAIGLDMKEKLLELEKKNRKETS